VFQTLGSEGGEGTVDEVCLVAGVASLFLRWEAHGVWGGEGTVDEVCLVAGVTSLFLRWEAPGVALGVEGTTSLVLL